jgi:hypothetical protein
MITKSCLPIRDYQMNIEHYSMFDPPEADSMLDVHLYFSCNN